MSDQRRFTRRGFIAASAAAAVGSALFAACQPQTVEVTKVVEKNVEVTKVVEKEKVVEKPVEVTKVVEKEKAVIVTATPQPRVYELKMSTDWNSGARKTVMDTAKAEWEKQNPNVKIEVWHMGGGGTSGPGGYTDIVVAQLVTDTVADITADFFWHPHVDYMNEIGQDVGKLGWKKENYVVQGSPGIMRDGKQYALPWNTVISGWIYNADLFKKAGIKEPTDAWTRNDMIAAAKAMTIPAEKQYGAHLIDYWGWGWGAWVYADGADIISLDGHKLLLDQGQAPDSFAAYVDLVFKDKISPAPGEISSLLSPGITSPFEAGRIGMTTAHLGSVKDMAKRIGTRFNWGLMPTPISTVSNKRGYYTGQDALTFPKVSKKRGTYEEALKFGYFHLSDFMMNLWAELGPSLPPQFKAQKSDVYLKAPPLNMAQVNKNYDNTEGNHRFVITQDLYPGGYEGLMEAVKWISTAFDPANQGKAKQIYLDAVKRGNDTIAKVFK